MIRRRYPTPREIRRAQWAWIPLLVPLFLLAWFGYRDISLNIQKRRLDYEFNQLTEKNQTVTRHLESVTAALAAKRGYWTSTAFAQSLGLQPPQPGQVITIPAIPMDQQIWELPLEPVQGQQALFAVASEPTPTTVPPALPAVPPNAKPQDAPGIRQSETVKSQKSKQPASKPSSARDSKARDKKMVTDRKASAKSAAPAAAAMQRHPKTAAPDENPSAWLAPL